MWLYPILFSINSRLQKCNLFACTPRMNNSQVFFRLSKHTICFPCLYRFIPELFTAIGPPSFIIGEGEGVAKKVALFQRHRHEEFSSGDSAGDFGLSFRRPEIYCEGPPSIFEGDGVGGGEGGAKSINYCSIVALRIINEPQYFKNR